MTRDRIEVLTLDRGAGKTTAALQAAIDLVAEGEDVVIVTPDWLQRSMIDEVRHAGLVGVRVMTVEQLHTRGRRRLPTIVDNVDLLDDGIWHPAFAEHDVRLVTATPRFGPPTPEPPRTRRVRRPESSRVPRR